MNSRRRVPGEFRQRTEAALPSLTGIALFHLEIRWADTAPPAAPQMAWRLTVASHPEGTHYQVRATLTHDAAWGHLEAGVAAITEAQTTHADPAMLLRELDANRLKAQCSPAMWAFARAISLPLVAAIPDAGESILPLEAPPLS